MSFVIRNVEKKDLSDILELSKLMVFINLPSEKDRLEKIINKSIESFKNPSKKLEENYFLFVLIDTDLNQVIGVSMIHGKHGSETEPHFYLKVGQEHKYSQSLNTGFVHGTLKFGMENNGWTEIGGLVLHPDYRGNENKLGKFLSYSRFLFIAFNQHLFTDVIHCELMPPFDSEGKSPLWEAIGRKFLNMDYNEADMLSRKNKEFIVSLYPQDTIYGTLLPAEARNAIGKVGEDTQPVKKMLETIGFKYMNEVDPFDGGPHYRAQTSQVSLIKNKFSLTLSTTDNLSENAVTILLSLPKSNHNFFTVKTKADFDGDKVLLLNDFITEHSLNKNEVINGIFF